MRKLAGNRATEVRFGRFLSNKKVTVKELISESTKKASELSAGRHVLAIQDTTELNYRPHKDRVKGLGPVGNDHGIGFYLHPMLVVDAASSACLGLGGAHTWIRPPQNFTEDGIKIKKKQGYTRLMPIEEKESYRWLEVANQAKEALKAAAQITIIADRESDIYEEWYRIPDTKTHLLTRASKDRRLRNEEMLFQYVSQLSVSGVTEIKVRARAQKRTAHIAKLDIRFGTVEIKRPSKCNDKNAPKYIKLRVVDVKERPQSVVGNEKPIHWSLLTTHTVETLEKALEITRWYSSRWHIEQLFRTLKKQGFQLESSQIEKGDSLIKLSIIALRAAVQTLQLSLSRQPELLDRPSSDVFSPDEETVLEAMQPRLEGKTDKQKNPYPTKKLAWAAWIIARLGGWKGYASERPPGPITMLNGQKEFASRYQGWKLAKDVCIP